MATEGIVYIKIARKDQNGVDITNTLESLSTIVLPTSTGNRTYTILNSTRESTYFLYYVEPNTDQTLPVGTEQSPNYTFNSQTINYTVNL